MAATDLAQQIRDWLDGLAPASLTFEFPAGWTDGQREQFNAEFKAAGPVVPPVFLEPAEPPLPEEIERWHQAFDELLPEGARVHQIRVLPSGPRFYPGFEQMRDAVLAVLDLHAANRGSSGAATWADCAHCRNTNWGGPDVPWPCETVEAMAKALGIEVSDG